MKYQDISEIKHLATHGYTSDCANILTRDTNKLLKEGWKIVDTYKTCHDEELFPNQQKFHVILGKPIDDSAK